MTWAEFQIRAYGWRRMDERKQHYLKKVAIAPLLAMGVKKNDVDKYWQIGNHTRKEDFDRVKNAMQKASERALKQYEIDLKNAKNKEGGR